MERIISSWHSAEDLWNLLLNAQTDLLDMCALRLQGLVNRSSERRLLIPAEVRVGQATGWLCYVNLLALLVFFVAMPLIFSLGMEEPVAWPTSPTNAQGRRSCTLWEEFFGSTLSIDSGGSATKLALPGLFAKTGGMGVDFALGGFANPSAGSPEVSFDEAVAHLAEATRTPIEADGRLVCPSGMSMMIRRPVRSRVCSLVVAFVGGLLLNLAAFHSVPCF